ncbi:hypothetical protein [Kribbella italica]|uniref:Uncharacterized protein n=1 Tax=Kribbella italica TaxID=1540520 RepID=A0A7W9MYC4_9ACTN|nr:hypothetical protein [Kribbella italica]MBB5840270.1 hypothetical protein [Kribbella italica]
MRLSARGRRTAVAAGAGIGTAGALVAVLMLGAASALALIGIVFALVWPLAAVIKHLADEPIPYSSASIAAYAAGAVLCLPGVARLLTWGAAGLAVTVVAGAAFAGLDLLLSTRPPREERRRLPWSRRRTDGSRRTDESEAALSADQALEDEKLIAKLQCPLSIEELCGVWRETTETLASGAGTRDRQAVAEVRRICLDEFERRNPEGFLQWIEAGAPSNPGVYLLPDRGPGTT